MSEKKQKEEKTKSTFNIVVEGVMPFAWSFAVQAETNEEAVAIAKKHAFDDSKIRGDQFKLMWYKIKRNRLVVKKPGTINVLATKKL